MATWQTVQTPSKAFIHSLTKSKRKTTASMSWHLRRGEASASTCGTSTTRKLKQNHYPKKTKNIIKAARGWPNYSEKMITITPLTMNFIRKLQSNKFLRKSPEKYQRTWKTLLNSMNMVTSGTKSPSHFLIKVHKSKWRKKLKVLPIRFLKIQKLLK